MCARTEHRITIEFTREEEYMLTLINGVSGHSPMFGVRDSDIAPNSMIGTEGWRQMLHNPERHLKCR